MRTRQVFIGIFMALLVFAASGRSQASDVRQGDQCVVGANETIDGNLFALCRTLVINGRVEGNLIGAATKSEINGGIAGDVYLLSGQLDVTGVIGGDLHFGGGVLRVLPTANLNSENGDLITGSLSTTLSRGANIPGSVTALGYQLILEGDVGKEVNFWGSTLTINSSIGKNVTANVGDPQSTGISQLQTILIPFGWDVTLSAPGLTVGKNAALEGNLRYSGPVSGVIEGSVSGDTMFEQVTAQPDLTQIMAEEQGAQRGLGVYLEQAVHEFITLALVGVIVVIALSRSIQVPIRNIQSRPLPSVGIGLLTFIVAIPVAIIGLGLLVLILIVLVVLLRLDGLMLGLAGGGTLGIWVGTALSFLFMAIFISRVIVGLWLGRALVRSVRGAENLTQPPFLGLGVGIGILALISPLPIIGWIINSLALFLGLGAIVIAFQGQLRTYRDTPVVMPPPFRPSVSGGLSSTRRLPPPLSDDHPKGVGMENLPEGFTWWDD